MSNPIQEKPRDSSGWLSGTVLTATKAVRVDLARLHTTWMRLRFPRDPDNEHPVVDGWEPDTARGAAGYRLWALIGAPLVGVVYPLCILGIATRYYANRIDRLSASLGFAGVFLLSLVAWGLLTAVTYLSPIALEGLAVVAIASLVATTSSVLALYITRLERRVATMSLAYPLGVTAIFLPPVVASLYSPTLAGVVFPHSTSLAIWLLDGVLSVGGLATFIRAAFELEGVAYVGMWFLLAFPVGWTLGGVVGLANFVRPADGHDVGSAWE